MSSHRVRDPVHGFLSFSPAELALIESRPFQRLRHIGQLALTDQVYPGATHTRFGHALGVAHVATRMVESLQRDPRVRELLAYDALDWARARQLVRLAALVHDLGHAPFSHAGEELFAGGRRHEHWSERLVRETELGDLIDQQPIFGDLGVDREAVIDLFGGGGGDAAGPLFSLVLAGQIDADRCDYLQRDAFFCGVEYGRFDLERLLETFTAWELPEGGLAPGVRYSGLCAAEGMVTARYLMYREVYYHKTRRILDLLLERALKALLPGGTFPDEVDAYLEWTDHRAWELLREGARRGQPDAQALMERRPLSCVLQVEETGSAGAGRLFQAALAELEPLGAVADTSARIRVFRPPEELHGPVKNRDEIWIVDESGRGRSLFRVSSILRRMDPRAEIQRIYVPREHRERARAIVHDLERGIDPRPARPLLPRLTAPAGEEPPWSPDEHALVIGAWLDRRRRTRILAEPFPSAWEELLRTRLGHWPMLREAEQQTLRDLSQVFIAEKNWIGAGGLDLTDEIRVVVAGTACLLLLGLPDHRLYRRVDSIVIYPTTVLSPVRPSSFFSGQPLEPERGPRAVLGEAHHGGPVVLVWDAARRGARHPRDGHNVILHEFAHKLDMLDGHADGTPPLRGTVRWERWVEVLSREFTALRARVERGRRGLLDGYGATNEAEFFAVAVEAFFEQPLQMKREHADLYGVLADWFRQDTAAREARAGRP